jgi:hypothetical protein
MSDFSLITVFHKESTQLQLYKFLQNLKNIIYAPTEILIGLDNVDLHFAKSLKENILSHEDFKSLHLRFLLFDKTVSHFTLLHSLANLATKKCITFCQLNTVIHPLRFYFLHFIFNEYYSQFIFHNSTPFIHLVSHQKDTISQLIPELLNQLDLYHPNTNSSELFLFNKFCNPLEFSMVNNKENIDKIAQHHSTHTLLKSLISTKTNCMFSNLPLSFT